MFKLLRKQKSWLGKLVVAALLLTLVSPCLAEAKTILGDNAKAIVAITDNNAADNSQNPMDNIAIDQDVDGHCCMSHSAKLSFDSQQTIPFSLKNVAVAMHEQQSLPNDFLLGLFRPPQA